VVVAALPLLLMKVWRPDLTAGARLPVLLFLPLPLLLLLLLFFAWPNHTIRITAILKNKTF